MSRPHKDIPLPTYDHDVNQVVRIYTKAINEVILTLENLSTHGKVSEASRHQITMILAKLAALLVEVDNEVFILLKPMIEKAFHSGRAYTSRTIGESKNADEAIHYALLSPLAKHSIETLISDTFEDLHYANQKMKRETIKMVRAIFAEQMKITVAQGMGRNTIRKAIMQALTKKELRDRFHVEANVAIIDKAGRKWKLPTYVEMVTRTKLLQAHTEGTRVEALERGVDLAIISSHNAKDACRRFEGIVISMNGHTKGYKTYDELRRSGLIFHPNCRHKITPVRDISLLPEGVWRKD